MRLSRYLLPTLKETPAEAQIASHRLMLRAGLVRQSSAGIYSWLPLGLRVLRNIERIVREEQDRAGCLEMLMPTIQPAELWRESGRYDAYGPEMLRIVDRHERELLYGPTNEELITEIVRAAVKSYRQLPKLLYHIQWKFRDEIRPRFGVMRGREFLMKDSYSFDLDRAGAVRAYHKMFVCYLRTFERMGLKAIPMQADTGPIGGDLSHEFVILADTGESEIAYHRDFAALSLADRAIDFDGDLAPIVDEYTRRYAATDERRDAAIRGGAGCGAGDRAGDRGRPHLLFRHQVFEAARRRRCRSRRRAGGDRDGLLRHRRLAAGRRHHRGLPRRRRHRLAGGGRPLRLRPDRSEGRGCRDRRRLRAHLRSVRGGRRRRPLGRSRTSAPASSSRRWI